MPAERRADIPRRLYVMLLRAGLCFALLIAVDAGADEAAVKKQFERRFPGSTVTSVAPAPMPGLYEVFVEGQLLYTDAEVNYILQGALIDAADKRNLTEERLSKLKGIPWDQLPLGLAIKIVKGNGARKVAIFEDPDCPFCRRLEQQELSRIDNLTMYILLYPLEQLHPGSTDKSIRVWCSADRGKAWTDAVLGRAIPSAPATCKHPVEALKKYAEARGIFATPTLVFEDGARVPGAIPAAEIEKRLAAARHQEGNRK
jgi:thiol:disulfide interchange protein DsbC